MKIEIFTKTRAEKIIKEKIAKNQKFIYHKIEALQLRIARLEKKLEERTGEIKLPGKNEV